MLKKNVKKFKKIISKSKQFKINIKIKSLFI